MKKEKKKTMERMTAYVEKVNALVKKKEKGKK